jgi:hypothetical protein
LGTLSVKAGLGDLVESRWSVPLLNMKVNPESLNPESLNPESLNPESLNPESFRSLFDGSCLLKPLLKRQGSQRVYGKCLSSPEARTTNHAAHVPDAAAVSDARFMFVRFPLLLRCLLPTLSRVMHLM